MVIFSELETGTFDPFLFINPKIDSNVVLLTDGELNLIKQGSAIALLAIVTDIYFDDECQGNEVMSYFINNEALPKGLKKRYSQLPKIKAIFDQNQIVQDPHIIEAFQ